MFRGKGIGIEHRKREYGQQHKRQGHGVRLQMQRYMDRAKGSRERLEVREHRSSKVTMAGVQEHEYRGNDGVVCG